MSKDNQSPQTPSSGRPLILGSTSRYRKELLSRLQIPFETVAPDVDETQQANERPKDLALRLALAKAQAVALKNPDAVVIGSDQVADLEGTPLGKPGNHTNATLQLQRMRGKTVIFQTALSVVCIASGYERSDLASVKVKFRNLTESFR
jgi:septum formation protein